MTLWDICIRRPVFTIVLVTAPIVMGVAAYFRLGVDLLPNVDLPIVSVTTTLRGASVEEMESGITKPIEEIVNTISGIDELRSTTKEGISRVIIQFVLEKNGAVAAQEVDAKVRTILSQLPQGTDPPIIDRFNIDAAPVMTIALSGNRSLRELSEIARKRLKEDLETLPGVGAAILVGNRPRAINIWIDPDRIQKYENLTIEDVRSALIRENQELPGGRVDQGTSELVLRTIGRVQTPSDFEDLIIANRGGQPIRIRDVGRVEDGSEEARGLSRLWKQELIEVRGEDYEGENAVSLIIQKQSGTNTVQVVDRVRKRLNELREILPQDIETEIIRDQSRFIRGSIEEVRTHLLLAAILVCLTILLFINDWRTTLIATLAIPTSVIGTFYFMQLMDFTLNNITMLALILAVGIVIDDAVVVHENIFRHMEEYGRSAWEAASTATSEIALAVMATTLSLLVIFVPIAFMEGAVGRFFSSFGFVVGFSILMSMAISFTLTPMLCARFLVLEESKSKDGFVWRMIEKSYVGILSWSLRNRWVIILLSVGTLLSTPVLMSIVGKDFIPRDDQSELEIALQMPEGYSLQQVDQVCRQIEARVRKLRGVTHTYLVVGDTTGRVTKGQGDVTLATLYVRLLPLNQRRFTQSEIQDDARVIMADYPDIRSTVQDVAAFQATGFRQVLIDLNLRGPDMDKLQEYSEQITQWMKAQGYFVDVDTSLSLSKPELRVRPDRERASELGVSIGAMASTVNVLVGGEPVSKYKELDEQYDVWLRAEPYARTDADTIARLTVPSSKPGVGAVPLASVARLETALGPNTIDRYAQQRQVVISANLKNKGIGDAAAALDAYIRSMNLPADYQPEFIGQAKTLSETNAGFLIAFLLSAIFMYLILAAQFESFVHPFTIMIALPLTIPFAILSLILLQTNLEIYGMFGLFMLFGIVKKNGILQVDYTNTLKARGMPTFEAIVEANRTRLRPILMTTVMLVAAMIPMALGQGPGAGARAGMAKVILGGQSLSLLLTLLLTPVCYSLWDDLGVWWSPKNNR
jgi:HAE1 family hydrophobic/amphiphilic exporter-1